MNASYTAILNAFTRYLQTLGFAPLTCYGYTRYIIYFLQYAEQKGIYQINRLTAKTVWDYFSCEQQRRSERTNRTLSTAALNTTYKVVDKFLEFLHHRGVNAPLPTHYKIEYSRLKPLQALTPDEIQTLYNTIPHTYSALPFAQREPQQMTVKLMLNLCYGCGLRRSEALKIKLNDINFEQKIIHVRQGKGYKDRFVPMSKKVYDDMQLFVYQYRKCFTTRPAYLYPFTVTLLVYALKILVKNCNSQSIQNKKPTLHTLRHSIATHLLQNGMSIENIARFLGHSTLESTKIYTHIVNEQL